MKANKSSMQGVYRIGLITLAILLVPLIAMQLTNNVNWSLSDFIIMGALIFTTGLALDLVVRKAGKYKSLGAMAIIGLFLWIWAELAVGVFTNWGS